MSNLDEKLDPCGCCETPDDPALDNRPGQPMLRWRLGTHSSFLARMKGAIPSQAPLAKLTTRSADDPSIAMMDACALVCDILSFYQERIANEGYIRTATERLSVLELARAIGYELNPGVAASTHLAFTVEEPPIVPTMPLPPNLPSIPPPILTPTTITVPLGTQVTSIPGDNELPQTFETLEEIEARVAWNAMRPRKTQRQQFSVSGTTLQLLDPAGVGAAVTCGALWLDGTATNLKPGDLLAVHVTAGNRDPSDPVSSAVATGLVTLTVTAVTLDDQNKRTRVDVAQTGADKPLFGLPDLPDAQIDTTPTELTADTARAKVLEQEWDEANLAVYLEIQRWDGDQLTGQISSLRTAAPPPAGVYAFRQKAGAFGNAAPPFIAIDAQQKASTFSTTATKWENYEGVTVWKAASTSVNAVITAGAFRSAGGGPDLYLDRPVAGVAAQSLVGLILPGQAQPTLFTVASTVEASLADFAIAGKATGLSLRKTSDQGTSLDEWTATISDSDKTTASIYGGFLMRKTTIFAQAEALTPTDAPIEEPVADAVVDANGGVTWTATSSVVLDRMILGLSAGRVVALSGFTIDANGAATGVKASELATIDHVVHTGGYTVLHFTEALDNRYDRSWLEICANLASASHGETQPQVQTIDRTKAEPIGSGDGATANQVFQLARPPLTYVSAATPSGGESTLTVRVNGVEWSEVASLYGQEPTARVYIVRIEDDGSTSVTFGDGQSGARLPTGDNNVTASYRSGIGTAGEIGTGRLTLLRSKPAGVKAAINPIEATGSEDPEELKNARENAPRTVRTLDRIVSLADYEDFARGFAGIAKAQAVPVWSGHTRLVHVTVASSTGDVLDPLSDTYVNLIDGIAAASDPSQPVQVDSFSPRFFKLSVDVFCDPDHDCDDVLADAQAAVEAAFSFAERAFAQAVTDAEIMGILHQVPGVLAVKIIALYHAEDVAPSVAGVLVASPARFDAATRTVLPAELLLLQAAGLTLTAVAS